MTPGWALRPATVALNLDWGGWAAFFKRPGQQPGRGGCRRGPRADGIAGIHTGWSGSHSFSITETCDNPEAAASFVTFLTAFDRQ